MLWKWRVQRNFELWRKSRSHRLVCENFSEYLFFDAYHLPGKANQQLAELMWNASDPNISGPYNLRALINL